MKSVFKIFLIAALTLCVASATALAATYTLDPKYSIILHRIKHLMGYSVGTFEKFNGTIEVDESKNKITAIDVTIDMDSLNTRHEVRDEDLRSEHFFDTKKFPNARFTAEKISKDTITGELTLKGVTRKVKLDYTWAGTGKDQYGNTKTALSARGTIDRQDFGISHNFKAKDNKWVLGDEVELTIEVQALRNDE